MKSSIQIMGIRDTLRALERIEKGTQDGMADVVERATLVVARSAKRRLRIPRQVSAQDSQSAKPGQPQQLNRRGSAYVKSRVDRDLLEGVVYVVPHWTRARSDGDRGKLDADLQRYVKGSELRRSTLWVFPQGSPTTAHHRQTGDGAPRTPSGANRPRRLRIHKYQRLAAWAAQPEKGLQYLRNAVRLRSAEARRDLILQPGADEAQPQVTRLFRGALESLLGA